MKVNILGEEYEVIMRSERSIDPKLEEADGYCDLYAKKIVVLVGHEDDPMMTENVGGYIFKILRHEVIHAVLYECGMDHYSADETLVDLLAVQLPKIAEIIGNIFDQLEKIENSSGGDKDVN